MMSAGVEGQDCTCPRLDPRLMIISKEKRHAMLTHAELQNVPTIIC